MADHFLQGLENFRQPFSLAQSDPNIEFISQDSVINPCHPQPSGLNIHRLVGYPTDNLPPRLPESPGNSENNFSGLLIHDNHSLVPPLTDRIVSNDSDRADKKRKAIEISAPGNSPSSSSLQASDNGTRRKKSSGRGKKVKGDVEDEKPREVVHVRAKRGQATDSHSLAERVRREKINEKLRCLQDIIPGCYKTMGMAVMLDEIINYVQSLQNQVEFLSMKLAAASTFYDFNSETDASETIQRAKTIEASKLQTGTNPGLNSAQFAPLYLNFGCNPQLPNSR